MRDILFDLYAMWAHINLLVWICVDVVYLVIDQNEYGVESFLISA